MKIQVTGEQDIDEITVNGGTPSRVVEVAAGLVSSVNGQTGAITGLATIAQAAEEAEDAADASIVAHVAADDPHGDRDYADGTFVPKAGGTVTGDLGVDGDLTALGVTDWVNVAKHGAVGAVTDEQAGIQAAVDATPIGGTVYLEARIYNTGSPVRVPPYVTLMGSHGAGEAQPGAPAPVTCLKPLPDFDGDAVIEILDQSLGGYDILASQQRIERLTIDGSAVPPENVVDGIRMTGQIQNPIIRDVGIRDTSGKGINTEYNFSAPPGPQAPFCIHMDRVSVLWPKDIGVALNNATDSNLNDVYVLGASAWGYWISGSGNSTMTACRSEWSGSDGCRITIGPGVLRMIGCSTDRSNGHGLDVRGTDPGFLVLSNCSLTRDGKWFGGGGGDKAALNIEDTPCHVLADGLVVTPGVDDGGAGTQSPQYGVRMIGSAYLSLASGLINGVTTAVHDAGGNTTLLRGASLKEATGPSTAVVLDPAAFTRTTGAYSAVSTDVRIATAGKGLKVAEGSNAKSGTVTLNGTTAVTVANTSVTATSRIQLTIQAPGGTVGSPYVSARTAGTSFQVKSTAVGDTSTAAYFIVETG